MSFPGPSASPARSTETGDVDFCLLRNLASRWQRALWRHRPMLDWTDIGTGGAFHTLWSEVSASNAWF